MEKFILRTQLKFMLPWIAISVAGCSVTDLEPVNGIDANTIVQGSFAQYDNAKISGLGTIRFDQGLPLNSNRSLSLQASLDQTIALSSVTAILFSSNSSLNTNDGLRIELSRNGASVQGSVSLNGQQALINPARLTFYYPANLDLVIYFNNAMTPARILMWRRDLIGYTPLNADVDTQRGGDLSGSLPVATAGGSISGLVIKNSTISRATISIPPNLN